MAEKLPGWKSPERRGFRGADLFRDPKSYHQAHRVLLGDELVTLKEAAHHLGRSYTYLCKLAKAGRLPAPLQALTTPTPAQSDATAN